MKKVQVLNCMRVSRWCQIRVGRRTGFLCADGQLFACLTASNLVVGIHANAVHGCRVELHYVGLVVCGRDLTGGMFQLPRVYDKDKITRLHYYITPPSRLFWNIMFVSMQRGLFTGQIIWIWKTSDALKTRTIADVQKQNKAIHPSRNATEICSHPIHLLAVWAYSLHILLTYKYIFNARSQCNSSKLEMETKQCRTGFVLVLDVVAGDDAVAVKPLRPPQVHTAIFDLSNLQLWGVRGFCQQSKWK